MCGICGSINYTQNKKIEPSFVRSMLQTITHRGPDDEGLYTEDFFCFGMRRLSIIDLSTGHQPISNETKTVHVICNGEIYNYRELKKELLEKGHIFSTSSDTEVIVHLYERYGEDFLTHLRGMFAIAVRDTKKNRLILARDRLGKKPLLYSDNAGNLTFASELKCLLKDSRIPRDLNKEALDQFLSLQYIPHPISIFNSIKKLPPAHFLVCENGSIKIQRYWSLDYATKNDLNEDEQCEKILETLRAAVSIRLVSDVPLGAFLSGGVDSSIVVALMAEASLRRVKTFSIGFEEKEYDESAYARIIAKKFNTEHHEFIVKPQFFEILEKFTTHFDEPFADSSAIPSLYVARLAANEIKVVLNGDGGDESFAGYTQYTRLGLSKAGSILQNPFHEMALNRLFRLGGSKYSRATLRRLFPHLKVFDFRDFFTNTDKERLYTHEFASAVNDFHFKDIKEKVLSACKMTAAELDRMLLLDMNWYIPCNQMYKSDISTMAYSLEARSPFLDHKLVELSASIPSYMKLKNRVTKSLLKKTFRNILPDEILYRPKKGLDIPLARWFQGDLKGFTEDKLIHTSRAMKIFFNMETIKEMLREHVSGKKNHERRLWALLVFELWFQKYAD